VAGATAFCGDGTLQSSNEACDDGNATCGTCNATCQTFASARAVGSISVLKPSDLRISGDTFTLNDGIFPPVTFEYIKTGGTAAMGNIVIDLVGASNSASEVANRTHAKIFEISQNSSEPFLAIAPVGTMPTGAVVSLRHLRFTSAGNTAITETVLDNDFTVSGMTGGAGGDCALGQACRSNVDCLSNNCNLTTKVCQ
jgi:cysteine-rich repeat protein